MPATRGDIEAAESIRAGRADLTAEAVDPERGSTLYIGASDGARWALAELLARDGWETRVSEMGSAVRVKAPKPGQPGRLIDD